MIELQDFPIVKTHVTGYCANCNTKVELKDNANCAICGSASTGHKLGEVGVLHALSYRIIRHRDFSNDKWEDDGGFINLVDSMDSDSNIDPPKLSKRRRA